MTTITCKEIERTYSNHGQHCEQMLAYTLTGELRKGDHVAFDKGSDIPEYDMSVKSSRATIVSARLMRSTTRESQIAEYFERVHSTRFAYVANNNIAYVMNAHEFEAFLREFVRFERESSENGRGMKLRLPAENKKILAWLGAI